MPDAATNTLLIQLGALGILGLGLTWIAKSFVPRVLAMVEKMIADHKDAMQKMGQDNKEVMKDMGNAHASAIQTVCDRSDAAEQNCRAERLTEGAENRRVLTDLTKATNGQTVVLTAMANKMNASIP